MNLVSGPQSLSTLRPTAPRHLRDPRPIARNYIPHDVIGGIAFASVAIAIVVAIMLATGHVLGGVLAGGVGLLLALWLRPKRTDSNRTGSPTGDET